MFDYKWNLKDGYPSDGIESHGKKVFGTFICGGGSSMGYKRAGFSHLGGVEIDKKIALVYKRNHNPKYLYNEDIRTFLQRDEYPDELYDLDILDGSPPCSSFSMAGNREKDWGKKKVFSEGQSEQRLDDLFFEYIGLVKKLKPKVAIAENVKGLLIGNAKAYVHKIKNAFNEAGYDVQLFLLNSATMGVPQRRERVFFVCRRKDLGLNPLSLEFSEEPILFSDIIQGNEGPKLTEYQKQLWDARIPKDKSFGDIIMRKENRVSMFSNPIIHENDVCPTITSSADVNALYNQPRGMSKEELCLCGSFPLDYDFTHTRTNWLIGMSVPPVMMANVSYQVYLQMLK
jgi:DNA (cytosine-5)-methyltransferase 1